MLAAPGLNTSGASNGSYSRRDSRMSDLAADRSDPDQPRPGLGLWSAVDAYIADRLLPEDPHLAAVLAASEAEGLPSGAISANYGKLLELLGRIHGARRILEVGTLGGYSTIWLARSLPPDGRLITLELDAHYAEVARGNLARAGFADVVEIRVGSALETLAELHAEGDGPFDLVFLDADKKNHPGYLEWSLKLRASRNLDRC